MLTQSNVCSACHSLCYSCSGPSQEQCTGCNNPYKLKFQPDTQTSVGICVPHCGKPFFESMGGDDNNFCVKCHESCEICTGPTENECYRCHETCSNCYGYYNKECMHCAAPLAYMYVNETIAAIA